MSRAAGRPADAGPATAAIADPAGAATPVTMPHGKPRLVSVAIAYRTYRLARRVLPDRFLARGLLTASWLMRRLAFEQATYWLGVERTSAVLRPHLGAFVEAAVMPGDTVIDLGCGAGHVSHRAATRAGRVVAVDLNPVAVQHTARLCRGDRNVEVIQGDALATLDTRGPFDVAFLSHVLEHLSSPRTVLERLRRQCRRVAIEVPDLASDPLNFLRAREHLPLYSDADHVTEFTVESLASCLAAAGWTVRTIEARNGVVVAIADAA